MAPDRQLVDLRLERDAAARTILERTPTQPNAIRYDQLWPEVLALHTVSKVDVNKIVARLRRENQLLIPDWEKRKQVPQDSYRLQRT
jgi:hypothetical protein